MPSQGLTSSRDARTLSPPPLAAAPPPTRRRRSPAPHKPPSARSGARCLRRTATRPAGAGELLRAFADRRDVAGDHAERQRRRVREAVHAFEARALHAVLRLKLERGPEIGRLGELVVFLSGRRRVAVLPDADARRDPAQHRPLAPVDLEAGREDQEVERDRARPRCRTAARRRARPRPRSRRRGGSARSGGARRAACCCAAAAPAASLM